MSDMFEKAWEIAKADTGMVDEIYAPLYEQLGGRGKASKRDILPLDFIPTSLAMEMLIQADGKHMDAVRHNTGSDGFNVDELKERILEHGFTIPKKRRTFSHSIPQFDFDLEGRMSRGEGRHRTLALHELGMPYIPSIGRGSPRFYSPERTIKPYNLNPIYNNAHPHSAAEHLGDRGQPSPPSYIFNQELIPGMGRLIPTIDKKPVPDEEMRIHRNKGRMDDWFNKPEWSVIYDE